MNKSITIILLFLLMLLGTSYLLSRSKVLKEINSNNSSLIIIDSQPIFGGTEDLKTPCWEFKIGDKNEMNCIPTYLYYSFSTKLILSSSSNALNTINGFLSNN